VQAEPLTDNHIMQKVSQGDIDQLGLLFEKYRRPLYGYFLNRTRDRTMSEDLVQMVFFRILKYRTKFGGHGQFAVWMYQIARNVMLDALKKKRKQPVSQDLNTLNITDDETGENRFLGNERLLLLRSALEALPEEQREVLSLSRFQGMKYREIGEIMGCSEGTVKVRVFRAIRALKTKYMELEGV